MRYRTIYLVFLLLCNLLPHLPHKLVGNVQIAVEVEAGGFVVEVGAGLAFVEQLQRLLGRNGVPSTGSDTKRLSIVASLRDAFYRGWSPYPRLHSTSFRLSGVTKIAFLRNAK